MQRRVQLRARQMERVIALIDSKGKKLKGKYCTIQYNIVTIQHRLFPTLNKITLQQHFVPKIGMVGKRVDKGIILSWSTPNID